MTRAGEGVVLGRLLASSVTELGSIWDLFSRDTWAPTCPLLYFSLPQRVGWVWWGCPLCAH